MTFEWSVMSWVSRASIDSVIKGLVYWKCKHLPIAEISMLSNELNVAAAYADSCIIVSSEWTVPLIERFMIIK